MDNSFFKVSTDWIIPFFCFSCWFGVNQCGVDSWLISTVSSTLFFIELFTRTQYRSRSSFMGWSCDIWEHRIRIFRNLMNWFEVSSYFICRCKASISFISFLGTNNSFIGWFEVNGSFIGCCKVIWFLSILWKLKLSMLVTDIYKTKENYSKRNELGVLGMKHCFSKLSKYSLAAAVTNVKMRTKILNNDHQASKAVFKTIIIVEEYLCITVFQDKVI